MSALGHKRPVAALLQRPSFQFHTFFLGGAPIKTSCESRGAVFEVDVPPKTWPGSPASRASLLVDDK